MLLLLLYVADLHEIVSGQILQLHEFPAIAVVYIG